MTEKEILKVAKYTKKILEAIEDKDLYTQSDLEGIINAIVSGIIKGN